MDAHYDRNTLAGALEQVGLRRGDTVFSHSNIGFFGLPSEGSTPETVTEVILGAFRDVLGPEGTLVVPTFTYSFCKGEPYDPERSPSTCGTFTEAVRRHPDSERSLDPIFSVAAVGGRAEEMTKDVSEECFGRDSFWDRFLEAEGVICNLNFDAGSTFIHFVERELDVPYRYDKLFPGTFVENGEKRRGAAIFFCHDLTNPDTEAVFEPFDEVARERELVRSADVGRGSVVSIRARDNYKLIQDEIDRNPWFLTAAGKQDREPTLLREPDKNPYHVGLGRGASMEEMLQTLWPLPRDLVSDGYDAALDALARQVPMTVHEYPTGTSCWDWLVPEKWTCEEAYIETIDGERILSYEDNPLHVASYSQSFEDVVPRRELFDHLTVHPRLPDAIPFHYHYYRRDWGFCCSQRTKEALTDDEYRVVLRSRFEYGELKVGEVVAHGESDACIVFCAHLDHPAQANDGLSGVVVGMDVMRHLLQRDDLHYTYRFVIVPETIGSLAYLSHNEHTIPNMLGGIFLEMLGLDHPHTLQLSHEADTPFDRCCRTAVLEWETGSQVGPFLRVVTNDERQFNAPGVRVPMLSLSRVERPLTQGANFPEYHSHLDSPELTNSEHLRESRDLILDIVDRWERERIPRNRFKGEVFFTRHGIHFDFERDPWMSQVLFEALFLMDGNHLVEDIAERCGITFDQAREIIETLRDKGLVEF